MKKSYILKMAGIGLSLAILGNIGTVSYVAASFGQSDSKYTLEKPKQSASYTQYLENKKTSFETSGSLPEPYAIGGTVLPPKNLPAKFNLLTAGLVTPVKDQGSLNDCWAFSGLSVLESTILKAGKGSYDFSEEHLNHWATKKANNSGWQRSYSDGGYSYPVIGYLTSWTGPRLETQFPYRSADNKTFNQLKELGRTAFGTNGIMYLNKDTNTVKQAIMKYGAVSANYNHDITYDNTKQTAYFQPTKINQGESFRGHGVSIVGWDDSYSRTNFNQKYLPQKNGAWLAKNSWGNYNELGGFFWISYEDYYLFSDTFSTAFVITDMDSSISNKKLYQNEVDGTTYDFNLSYSDNTVKKPVDNITFINVFDFSDSYKKLSAITFESQAIGAAYNLYYIPLEGGSPTQDKTRWIPIGTGTVDYSGYIKANTNFKVPSGKAAIGVTIDAVDGSNHPCSLGCNEWLTYSNTGEYLYLPNPKSGDSFVVIDGAMTELLDFYKTVLNDKIGSTFVIKAIAEAVYGDVNGDNKCNLKDAVSVQRYVTDSLTLTPDQLNIGDVNCDGKIKLVDATLIQTSLT